MMDRFFFDSIIIGGGIVGQACALNLQQKNNNCLLIEKNSELISETSSRNSGVIHSGIYYNDLPNKKFHCLRGRDLIYDYCSNINLQKKHLANSKKNFKIKFSSESFSKNILKEVNNLL